MLVGYSEDPHISILRLTQCVAACTAERYKTSRLLLAYMLTQRLLYHVG